MYFETSLPTKKGAKVVMRSPTIETADDVCLTFKYHMYGATMGTLNVQIDDGTKVTVWSTSGNQGKTWLEAKIDISRPRPYHVNIYSIEILLVLRLNMLKLHMLNFFYMWYFSSYLNFSPFVVSHIS